MEKFRVGLVIAFAPQVWRKALNSSPDLTVKLSRIHRTRKGI
jgi:hypothetical protein